MDLTQEVVTEESPEADYLRQSERIIQLPDQRSKTAYQSNGRKISNTLN